MKFNLENLDFGKELVEQLKKQHYDNVNDMIKKGITDNDEKKEITLFHGTSLYYLNNILLNGLAPGNETKHSNYEAELKSNEHLVYLTNKWHYWYAHSHSSKLAEKERNEQKEHNSSNFMPCYVECKVPASQLIIDEDFFHSRHIKDMIKACIKKRNPILELSYEESINHYATSAHLGRIERENLVSFTILGNAERLHQNFIDKKSIYQKDLARWGVGKGKGKLRLYDLFELEDDPANLTFHMKDIPKGCIITEFVKKEGANLFSIELGTVSSYTNTL